MASRRCHHCRRVCSLRSDAMSPCSYRVGVSIVLRLDTDDILLELIWGWLCLNLIWFPAVLCSVAAFSLWRLRNRQ